MWWWILIWLLLALAAVATFVLLGWRLVRQVIALGRELRRSADRVAAAMDVPPTPYQSASSVIADPSAAPPPRTAG